MKKTTLLIMGSLLFIAVMTGLAVSTAPAQSAWTPPPISFSPEVTGMGGAPIMFIMMMLGVGGVILIHHAAAFVRRHYGIEL